MQINFVATKFLRVFAAKGEKTAQVYVLGFGITGRSLLRLQICSEFSCKNERQFFVAAKLILS